MPGLLRDPSPRQGQVRPVNERQMIEAETPSLNSQDAGMYDCSSDDGRTADGRLRGEQLLMYGYNDCAAEAVRFLVEHEQCQLNHPTVIALAEHLQARSAYLEYLALLERSSDDKQDELTAHLYSDGQQTNLSPQQRHLVETAFRGCDLLMSNDVTQTTANQNAPHPPNSDKLHFNNNQYLDQILAWAYCGEDDI